MKIVERLEEIGREDIALEVLNAEPDDTGDADDAKQKPELLSDRERLGTLLRRGQRLAAHMQTRIALPEFTGWAQDVQHFMNEFGL